MIGVKKRILVFTIGGSIIVPMVNPVIIKKENRYEIEESCLSLTGFRKTTRYEKIEVEYLDKDFKKQKQEDRPLCDRRRRLLRGIQLLF